MSVGRVVPGDVSGLRKNYGEKNSKGSEEVLQEEIFPELTERMLNRDSLRIECTALRRRRQNWSGKFPCGVCGKGVRHSIRCETCFLWIHHGKTKICTGLKNRRQYNVKSYNCSRCIKKKHNKSQKTDNLNAGNNKPKNTKKRSLERTANETDELALKIFVFNKLPKIFKTQIKIV